MLYDLKLQKPYKGKKTAQWEGKDGVDAAKRFLDCCDPNNAVIAFRPAAEERFGVFVLGHPSQIID